MQKHEQFSTSEEQRRRWVEVLEERQKDMAKLRVGTIDHSCISETGLSLHDLMLRYSSTKAVHCLDKLQPTLDRLHEFNLTITDLVHTGTPFTSLIWWCLFTLLDLSSRTPGTFEKVVDMFDQLTKAMSRTNRYATLYINWPSLQSSLRAAYSVYIEFCVYSIRFFQRNLSKQVLLDQLISELFEEIMTQVERILTNLREEVQHTHNASLTGHGRAMESGKQDSGAIFRARSFSVPFSQNSRFCGREKELEVLQECLAPSTHVQRSCAIQGIGGQGKTELAVEFSYRHRDRYHHIFWARAQDEFNLAQSFIRMFDRLFPPQDNTMDQHPIQDMLHWLCDNHGWLLIFDNVEDRAILNQYWPSCRHGAIIMTTQSAMDHGESTPIMLRSLEPKAGSGLLLKHLEAEDAAPDGMMVELGEELSKEVGGLPLTLVRLAGHIKESRSSLANVLDAFQQAKIGYAAKVVFDEDVTPFTFQYNKSMRMVFDMAMKSLLNTDKAVLNIMALLSPDDIPERIFSDESLGHAVPLRFDKGIQKRLSALHFIEFDAQAPRNETHLSLHRSLQLALLDDLSRDPGKLQGVFDLAVVLLRRELPAPSECMVPIQRHWPVYAEMFPHVLSIWKVYSYSNPRLRASETFAELLYGAGNHLYERSLDDSGKSVLTTAKDICETLISSSQDITGDLTSSIQALSANILTVLSGIYLNRGGLSTRRLAHVNMDNVVKYREAYRNIVSFERMTVPDLLLFANMRNDKACQLIDEEQYDFAEVHLMESLDIKYKLQEKEKDIPVFEFAESKKNLAIVRMSQGRVDEALQLSQQAVNHFNTLADQQTWYHELCRFTHAILLFNAGHYQEALSLHRTVYEARCALYGKLGHATLHSCFFVALAEYTLNNVGPAREALEPCLGNPVTVCVNNWPVECSIRAIYLQSHILEALGETEAVGKLRLYALTERDRILYEHGDGVEVPLSQATGDGMTQMVIFDHLVNSEAGRTTIGRSRHGKVPHRPDPNPGYQRSPRIYPEKNSQDEHLSAPVAEDSGETPTEGLSDAKLATADTGGTNAATSSLFPPSFFAGPSIHEPSSDLPSKSPSVFKAEEAQHMLCRLIGKMRDFLCEPRAWDGFEDVAIRTDDVLLKLRLWKQDIKAEHSLHIVGQKSQSLASQTISLLSKSLEALVDLENTMSMEGQKIKLDQREDVISHLEDFVDDLTCEVDAFLSFMDIDGCES